MNVGKAFVVFFISGKVSDLGTEVVSHGRGVLWNTEGIVSPCSGGLRNAQPGNAELEVAVFLRSVLYIFETALG